MDPFVSPKILLHRAHQHITEFDAWLLAYRNQKPYEIIKDKTTEYNKTIYKARITKNSPLILSVILFDAINCLRSSLDHTVFDASRLLGGNQKPKYTKFPFGSNETEAMGDLPRKKSEVPEAIRPLLLSFKPYPEATGGNQMLWSLNDIRNSKIHRILSSVITQASRTGANILNSGLGDFSIQSHWDDERKEYTFLTIGSMNEIELEVSIDIDVSFGAGTSLSQRSALGSLREMLLICDAIVTETERETRRLAASP